MNASKSRRRPMLLRALGGGSLVRRHDRIEAIVALLILTILVLAVPAAVWVGSGVSDANIERGLQYERSLHSVEATVVHVATGAPSRAPQVARNVGVRWSTAFQERTESISTAEMVRLGDTITVWLDEADEVSQPPRSAADLRASGVVAGLALWAGTTLFCLAAGMALRHSLDRRRYAAWDHEWLLVSASGGGWANRDH